MAKLLPIRHPQDDFFIADIFDGLPVKDDMASMEHPIFSLSKVKDVRTIQYERSGIKVTISPSSEHGLPTIFDKDVLLYLGSLLMSEMKKLEANGGKLPSKTIRISINDLLITTNRISTGEGYDLLEKALDRLHGVSIKTNIKTGKIEQKNAFHLIESYEFIESHYVKDRRVALEITVSDWFYNSIIAKEALTINRDYFRLGKPLERRIYEIVRKHCGNQNEWRISMQTLYEKSGSTGTLRKFRFYVKGIVKDNHLPDYLIEFFEASDTVLFRNRKPHISLNENLAKDTFVKEASMTLSLNTIKKGEELVEKASTGWSYQELRNQFAQELVNGFTPDKVDGAFLNFIKKKVKHLPGAYIAPTTPSQATRTTKKKIIESSQAAVVNTTLPVIGEEEVKQDVTPLVEEKPQKQGFLRRLLPW
jgi:plasmid replication initiation protein